MQFLVAATLLFASACGPGSDSATATVFIHWRFADARRCAEAGASQMQIGASDGATLACQPATCVLPCSDGESQNGAALSLSHAGARLQFAAVSPMGNPLYRGTLDLAAPLPAAADVLLYFTGGR